MKKKRESIIIHGEKYFPGEIREIIEQCDRGSFIPDQAQDSSRREKRAFFGDSKASTTRCLPSISDRYSDDPTAGNKRLGLGEELRANCLSLISVLGFNGKIGRKPRRSSFWNIVLHPPALSSLSLSLYLSLYLSFSLTRARAPCSRIFSFSFYCRFPFIHRSRSNGPASC